MPTWLNIEPTQKVWQKLNEAYSRGFILPNEHDPLTDSELELGLRVFGREGTKKFYAKDLDSGIVGEGTYPPEAIEDLRNKMKTQ